MDTPQTLPFDTFWSWLIQHPDCILRAGTPEAVLYDDDDLHWSFAAEGNHVIAQVLRGKLLMGELLVDPEQVTYVETQPGDREGEVFFHLVSERPSESVIAWFFVLTHGYGEGEGEGDPQVH